MYVGFAGAQVVHCWEPQVAQIPHREALVLREEVVLQSRLASVCHPGVGHLEQQVDLLLSLLVEVACQVARNQVRVVLEEVVGVVVSLAAVVRDQVVVVLAQVVGVVDLAHGSVDLEGLVDLQVS